MSPPLRILNCSRGTVLGTRVALAASWLSRLRGYLGRPQPRPGDGLLLSPCNSVHMWGMRFALDVVFLSGSGEVLALEEGLQPSSRPVRVRGSRYVLELPPGTIRSTATEVGDAFAWSPVDARRPLEAL